MELFELPLNSFAIYDPSLDTHDPFQEEFFYLVSSVNTPNDNFTKLLLYLVNTLLSKMLTVKN